MLNFKSTNTTKTAAHIIGAVYVGYAIFMIGLSGLLMSLAIGLIVLGIQGSMEFAVAAAILVGLLMKYVFKCRSDGFMNFTPQEVTTRIQNMETPKEPILQGFQTMSPAEVVQRLAGMKGASQLNSPPVGYDGRMGPQGVMASKFAEGFANPDANTDATNSSDSSASDVPASPSSTSASANAPPASAAATNAEPTAPSTSGFQGGKNDGLFKLGEIPSEGAGGPHLDAGSTILNAIQNLNPGQLKNMTDDTRKLLDTQKSLLQMLDTMKPMISDGSQLLNSFNTMFGKDGTGGLGGALKLGA